ncbi:hypothetical protein D3C87_1318970 [compost metagenome]
MTEYKVAETTEDILRHEIGRLKFMNGHLLLVLQDFVKQYQENVAMDLEDLYLRANGMLELAGPRT